MSALGTVGSYGGSGFANRPAPKMMTRRTIPTIAIRWRKKRLRAYDHWLRALTSSPCSNVMSTWSATPAAISVSPEPGWVLIEPVPTSGGSWSLSVIPDPRVKEAVDEVCDQVEGDHHH